MIHIKKRCGVHIERAKPENIKQTRDLYVEKKACIISCSLRTDYKLTSNTYFINKPFHYVNMVKSMGTTSGEKLPVLPLTSNNPFCILHYG